MVFKDNWLTFNPNLAQTLTLKIVMPNDANMQKAFFGTLFELSESENWVDNGGITPDEMAELWLVVIDTIVKADEVNLLGTILPYVTVSPPPNCLDCDGATYLRTDYPALYNQLGNTFWVDADHFVVPDLRGRVPLGVSATHAINTNGGSETHTLTIAEIPSHNHQYTRPNDNTGNEGSGGTVIVGSVSGSIGTTNTGGGEPHNNMQPYLTVKYCIVAV